MINLVPKYITNFSFRSQGIVEWTEYIGDSTGRKTREVIACMPKDSKAKGIMTEGAGKRLKKTLELWFNAIECSKKSTGYEQLRKKFHLSFVTLTLPALQQHDDKFIKRFIFWPWVEQIQRQYGVKYYIWRAEKQKNGNIHFHIVIDKFIKHELIRHHWNHHLNNHGYISAYSEKRKSDIILERLFLSRFTPESKPAQLPARIASVLKEFFKSPSITQSEKTVFTKFAKYVQNLPKETTVKNILLRLQCDERNGFNSPNSSDVHSPVGIRNMVAYISKYMSKKKKPKKSVDESRNTVIIPEMPVLGRIWGRSENLGKLQYFTEISNVDTHALMTEIRTKNIGKIIDESFFSYYRLPVFSILKKLSKKLFSQMIRHFRGLFEFLYFPSPPELSLTLIPI